MNIVLTGSISNVGKPLTQQLVKKGHTVTVITSKQERRKDIESLGAKAAVGSMFDVNFLSTTFETADIVYLMENNGRSRRQMQRIKTISEFHTSTPGTKRGVLLNFTFTKTVDTASASETPAEPAINGSTLSYTGSTLIAFSQPSLANHNIYTLKKPLNSNRSL